MNKPFQLFVLCASCNASQPAVVTVAPIASPSTPPPLVHVETAAPVPEHAVDINFENMVHLVATRIDPEHASHGDHVKLTFTWRCDAAPGDGWQLFTHLYDAKSNKTDNLDYAGPLREPDARSRQRMGPERWEAGQTYIDKQTYRIPDWVTGPLIVYVGVWRADTRMHVVAGPNDGENRGIAGKIDVK